MEISVVMPVYNTSVGILNEAVESILNQTFGDYEFIIIDDGSVGETRAYLESLSDPRIRLIRNSMNLGITKSLNIGFAAAQGKYIARMDGDDVSFHERFEKQIAFMKSHPDVIVCGTRVGVYGKQLPSPRKEMESMMAYRVRMLFTCPGPMHPTAFFDREKLVQHHITYDEKLIYAQDYGMWMTVSQYGRVCILPEVLLLYRHHPDQIAKAHHEEQVRCAKLTQRRLLEQLLDNVTEEELDLHFIHSTDYYRKTVITPQVAAWYDRLLKANKQRKIYDQRLLKRHTEWIKRRLIYQSFRSDMSQAEKAMLFLRYLSLRTVAGTIRGIMKEKIKEILR